MERQSIRMQGRTRRNEGQHRMVGAAGGVRRRGRQARRRRARGRRGRETRTSCRSESGGQGGPSGIDRRDERASDETRRGRYVPGAGASGADRSGRPGACRRELQWPRRTSPRGGEKSQADNTEVRMRGEGVRRGMRRRQTPVVRSRTVRCGKSRQQRVTAARAWAGERQARWKQGEGRRARSMRGARGQCQLWFCAFFLPVCAGLASDSPFRRVIQWW